MFWILSGLCVVALALMLFRSFWIRRQVLKPSGVQPYSEIRSLFFQMAKRSQLSPVERPPHDRNDSRDFRLPRKLWMVAADIAEPDEVNWTRVQDLLNAVRDSIQAEVEWFGGDAHAYRCISHGRMAIAVAGLIEMEINNGGLDQFFINSSGNIAALAPQAFRTLGAESIARILDQANSMFPEGPPEDRNHRVVLMESHEKAMALAWDKLDSEFFALPLPYGGSDTFAFQYVASHLDEFFQP